MTDEIFVTCGRGIAPILAAEIEALGLPAEQTDNGVWTRGGPQEVMRLNLHLRTAMRVLVKLDAFTASTPDALYTKLHDWPWENLLPADGYLCVNSSVKNPHITDTRFANLKAKDAIVDRLRDQTGERPDSGPRKDGMVVFVYWLEDDVTVFLDSSGIPLSRRSYRHNPWRAPMQESLAAACLLASEWDPKTPFVNPMCGSGTLGIEAAWLAMNRAPGILRETFGFQFVYGFSQDDWVRMCQEAEAAERPLETEIIMSDRDPGALDATEANLARAFLVSESGQGRPPVLQRCSFEQTDVPELGSGVGSGLVMINPPYGQRMGKGEEAELLALYQEIGRFFKQRCPGYRGGVFSGNPKLARQFGLTLAENYTFWSGPLECRLNFFDIFTADQRAASEAAEEATVAEEE